MELVICEDNNWICIVLGNAVFRTYNMRSASFLKATKKPVISAITRNGLVCKVAVNFM
jgi:hypothetical protein